VWDKGCYNPVTGVTTAGGGGYYKSSGRKLKQSRFRAAPGWTTAPTERDRTTVSSFANGTAGQGKDSKADSWGVGGWRAALGLEKSTSGGGGGGGGGSSNKRPAGVQASGTSWSGDTPREREPNLVYTAAVGAVEHTIRTQAPEGSRVINPPPGEVAAAGLKPDKLTPQEIAAAAAEAARLDEGGWQVQAADVQASGKESGAWRDVYMSAAYYDPSQGNWGIEFRCRFRNDWNVRNSVTLLATVIKSGVLTYGSASSQVGYPLGLAYPQVAVRGGTMLITYTYSSYGNLDNTITGVKYTDQPAYAGEWDFRVSGCCKLACVWTGWAANALNRFTNPSKPNCPHHTQTTASPNNYCRCRLHPDRPHHQGDRGPGCFPARPFIWPHRAARAPLWRLRGHRHPPHQRAHLERQPVRVVAVVYSGRADGAE